MVSMKQRIIRIVALILAVSLLIGAIPVAAILISKFLKDDETSKGPISLSVSNNTVLVTNANNLANGVNVAYDSGAREDVIIENQNMTLQYSIMGDDNRYVDSITNKDGMEYVTDTMDMYVRMKNGNTYYSSYTQETVTMNIFRYGYYYYDTHLQGQDFINLESALNNPGTRYENIPLTGMTATHMVKGENVINGKLESVSFTVNDITDPGFRKKGFELDASRYQYIKLKMKVDNCSSDTLSAQLFIIAGNHTTFSETQRHNFKVIADGAEHEYYLPLHSIIDYTGTLSGLRFDMGSAINQKFTVTEISAVDITTEEIYGLKMDRNFHTYSDKINHVAQVTSTKDIHNVEAIGMQTKIAANTVNKIIIRDTFTYHTDLDNVNWETVEYAGFDIKDAGIFGYIPVNDPTSGQMRVTLKDGYYIITQERSPVNNMVYAVDAIYNNTRDFYLGQRIYTDNTHSFQGLMNEAYEERNPIPSNHIQVNTANSTDGEYVQYDALRGAYVFKLKSLGFSDTYYDYPNRHCNLDFSIIGDSQDRNIYIVSTSTTGCLEAAALLDSSGMMLPVPLEVCKAFSGDKDTNLYQYKDKAYGETIFPMVIKAQETNHVNLINMYQNWGNFPLKQISSIQFGRPYYHLSTGVTETNCISNYSSSRLPDHRAMSGSMWLKQPQHTSAGGHEFLRYTDAQGNYSSEENVRNTILSYGPTYSDIKMEYLSYDGKIKVTYDYIEMPQTDENRGYWIMSYEVLEDITFSKFTEDFQFYSITSNDPSGEYTKIGYLNKDNDYTTLDVSMAGKGYNLGTEVPYFSYYDMDKWTSGQSNDEVKRYCNLSFIIQDYKFNIANLSNPAFRIYPSENKVALTLAVNGELTLKAGDTISMNAIIMPWGTEEMEEVHDGKNYYDNNKDLPVRKVRESLLPANRLKAEAVADCKVVEHPFLPQIKTNNGISAEFKVAGGGGRILTGISESDVVEKGKNTKHNNIAVRVDGFNNLNRPIVYELINDKWTLYELSSKNNPDKYSNKHDYDGYAVYYNQDGTYSYSFVVQMDSKEARIFKIVVGPTYTLTVDANGGTIGETNNWTISPDGSSATRAVVHGSTYGSNYDEIPTPTREGYTFDGWYTQNLFNYRIIPQKSTLIHTQNGIKILNANSTSTGITPEQFLTYTGLKVGDTATFSAIITGNTSPTAGKVAFRAKSGSDFVLKNATNESTTFIIPEGFNSDNYYGLTLYGVIDGEVLFTDIQVIRKITNSAYVRDARDHTIIARWIANEYVVTFDADGGTIKAGTDWTGSGSVVTQTVSYGSTYSKLPIPTREGHTFAGWYIGETRIDENSIMSQAQAHTITAKWTEIEKE